MTEVLDWPSKAKIAHINKENKYFTTTNLVQF